MCVNSSHRVRRHNSTTQSTYINGDEIGGVYNLYMPPMGCRTMPAVRDLTRDGGR